MENTQQLITLVCATSEIKRHCRTKLLAVYFEHIGTADSIEIQKSLVIRPLQH